MVKKIFLLKQVDRWVGRSLVWFFSWFLKIDPQKSPPSKIDVQRILVIRPGGFGDAVLLTPMLSALRSHYHTALVDVLAEKRNGGIFNCDPSLINELFLYDRGSELFKVMTQSYDLIVDTEQSHYLSAVVARFTRARYRIGFGTNDRRFLFHRAVDYSQEDYEVESFLNLLEALTGEEHAFLPDQVFFPRATQKPPQGKEIQPNARPFRVLLAPGATIPERRWAWERYRSLAKGMLEKGVEVVLIGTEVDRSRALQISEGLSGLLVDQTGKTSLRELWQLVCEGDLLISCDTGVLHLAYGVGTPSLSLFGASNEKKWAPKGRNHQVLNQHLSCSPCALFGETPPCPIGIACLENISVEEVEKAAWKMLRA